MTLNPAKSADVGRAVHSVWCLVFPARLTRHLVSRILFVYSLHPMKENTASKTAFGTAAGRALEASHPARTRIVEDQFAYGLLSAPYKLIVSMLAAPLIGPVLMALGEKTKPGIVGSILCRTRFIDNALRAAIKSGFRQVVIIGAGLDSRAQRIQGIEEASVYELDHPATQLWKRQRIRLILGKPAPNVILVPIDFEHEALSKAMAHTTFDRDADTFFIWEGVSQYLRAKEVDATLHYIVNATRGESRVAFTYVDKHVVNGQGASPAIKRLMKRLEKIGEPWLFGIDPDELERQFLKVRGLQLMDSAGADEYHTRYLAPTGRRIDIFKGEHTVLARTPLSESRGQRAEVREQRSESRGQRVP